MREPYFKIELDCLVVQQPMGDFYITSIPASELVKITDFDVRRVMMEERDVERYLGIQRPLNKRRVAEIRSYVSTLDACFPTAVIIAVEGKCAEFDAEKRKLTLRNFMDTDDESEMVLTRQIGRVLDGQHRLAGLDGFDGQFEVNISVFVDADIADQAAIFSTVNLAQTKVNKSLAYDLFDLMESRSPQKTAHNIAVTLDREKDSPFFKMIKRLGVATPGRTGETLTQATVVEPILEFITDNAMRDRDLYLRGKKPKKIEDHKLEKHPFQHMFVDNKDFEITDIIWNYFVAVRDRWPDAWASRDRGVMLNKTNGYRALTRFLRPLYLNMTTPGRVPKTKDFFAVFSEMSLSDENFNVDNFKPGSSGQSELFHLLMSESGLDRE